MSGKKPFKTITFKPGKTIIHKGIAHYVPNTTKQAVDEGERILGKNPYISVSSAPRGLTENSTGLAEHQRNLGGGKKKKKIYKYAIVKQKNGKTKKVIIEGKKKVLYKKNGSQKMYVKSKGRMMNQKNYKKACSRKNNNKKR